MKYHRRTHAEDLSENYSVSTAVALPSNNIRHVFSIKPATDKPASVDTMQQHRKMSGSPHRTMVSAGPTGGLQDRVELIDEKAGLLHPGGTPSRVSHDDSPAKAYRRRSSNATNTGGAPPSATMGSRNRSVVSIASASGGPGWKLKYQDFMPESKHSSGGVWETQESFS